MARGTGGELAMAPATRLSLRQWLELAVLLSGTFLAIMDVFIVNVAIPSIRQGLGASFAEVEFVVAGYGLTYAVSLITGGRLGDIHGRRRMFQVGMSAFMLTSTACGLAPSASLLVSARLSQGVAAAIMFPQVFSLIRVNFAHPGQRATAFAAMGAVLGMASIAGQVLGGLLVEADIWGLGWRPVFLVNLPIGLAALAASPFWVAESRAPGGIRLDLAGVSLGSLGLGLLLFPLIEGRELGWPSWAYAMLACSAPVLAVFGAQQHRKAREDRSPLLETSLFRDRGFLIGVLVVLIFYSTLNSSYLALTLLLQAGLGCSPLHAGLFLAANALAFMAASVLAGRLPRRWARQTLVAGAALAAASSLLAAATGWRVIPLTGRSLLPALALWGVGQGLLMTPLLNTVLGRVHEHYAGAAAGVLSTMQQVGGALGVAVVGVIFFTVLERGHALGLGQPEAYTQAFWSALLYGALGGAFTCLLLLGLPKGSLSPGGPS